CKYNNPNSNNFLLGICLGSDFCVCKKCSLREEYICSFCETVSSCNEVYKWEMEEAKQMQNVSRELKYNGICIWCLCEVFEFDNSRENIQKISEKKMRKKWETIAGNYMNAKIEEKRIKLKKKVDILYQKTISLNIKHIISYYA